MNIAVDGDNVDTVHTSEHVQNHVEQEQIIIPASPSTDSVPDIHIADTIIVPDTQHDISSSVPVQISNDVNVNVWVSHTSLPVLPDFAEYEFDLSIADRHAFLNGADMEDVFLRWCCIQIKQHLGDTVFIQDPSIPHFQCIEMCSSAHMN